MGVLCRDCGVYVFGPRFLPGTARPATLSRVTYPLAGLCTVSLSWRVPPSGWPGPVPYILGQVELPEGPQVLAEVVECAEADLKIGMDVELAIHLVNSEPDEAAKSVYKWRPAG